MHIIISLVYLIHENIFNIIDTDLEYKLNSEENNDLFTKITVTCI